MRVKNSAGMINLSPMCLTAFTTGSGLVLMALGIIGGLYWLRLRAKREQDSAERQRERLRREYWAQMKS
jgi:hypothetical protein